MILYTENITSRFLYVVDFVFHQLAIKVSYTDNIGEFTKSKLPKINYSDQDIESSFYIKPSGLLTEDSISAIKPELTHLGKLPVLYYIKGNHLNFDIFSAVFWFISRYEEYQNYTPDKHGRFAGAESFVFKNNIIDRPIVDEWIQFLSSALKEYFSGLKLKEKHFSYLTTIDVDSPWCYKNKGFKRTIGGALRDLLKLNYKALFLRFLVLSKIVPDPWYQFTWLTSLQEKMNTKFNYFIHVGDHGRFDKSISYKKAALKKMIKYLSSNSKVALHPSYNAHNKAEIFKTELERLSLLKKKTIHESRQHYLVFELKKYYPMLIELGITNDYSMGFADKVGFRAGTSNPFYFFDLKNNRQTNLLVHPFVIMDRTLNSYENKSISDAEKSIIEIIAKVKKVNGTFVSLWHNESLSDSFEWKGWKELFIKMHQYLSSN